MRRLLLIIAAVVVVLVAVVFIGVGRSSSASGDTSTTTNSVTTVGHGVVAAVPNQASVSAGVQTMAKTASAALASNSATMTKVIAAMKKAGGTQLQTQEVSLSPQTNPAGRVTGYVAQNTVSATTTIPGAGRVIDAAVAAGANTVDGPDLSVSDQDGLYRQALGKALDDAKAKAQALATAGGFTVGQVQTVIEQSTETPVTFGAAAVAPKAATPIEAGSQDITADVQVSFAIQ